MFCNKCGAQLPEQAGFCPNCGEKIFLQGQVNFEKEQQLLHVQSSRTNKNRTIGMLAVGFVIIGMIAAVTFLFAGRDYKEAIDVYVEASFSNDPKAIKESLQLLPEEMLEGALIMLEKSEDIVGIEELVEYMQEIKEDSIAMIENQYGEDFTYTYKIIEEEDYSKTKIRKLNDTYRENLEEADIDWEREIEEAKDVTVEITISSKDEESSIAAEMTIKVIKIGRMWYLADAGL